MRSRVGHAVILSWLGIPSWVLTSLVFRFITRRDQQDLETIRDSIINSWAMDSVGGSHWDAAPGDRSMDDGIMK